MSQLVHVTRMNMPVLLPRKLLFITFIRTMNWIFTVTAASDPNGIGSTHPLTLRCSQRHMPLIFVAVGHSSTPRFDAYTTTTRLAVCQRDVLADVTPLRRREDIRVINGTGGL